MKSGEVRKGLFWFMISEVSDHGLAGSQAETSWQKDVADLSYSPSRWEGERGKEHAPRLEDKIHASKSHSQ